MYYVTWVKIAAMSTMIKHIYRFAQRLVQLCSHENVRDTNVVKNAVKWGFRHYFQGSWNKVLTHPADWLFKCLHDRCAWGVACAI